MTVFSGHKDLAYGTVLTPPSPALSGTSLTLRAGEGALLPSAVPFYATVAPPAVLPTHANAEVVSVTNVAGDVVTITRAEGGTVAQAVAANWQFYASVTSEWADEVEAAVNAAEADIVTIESTAVFDGDAAGGDLAGTFPSPVLSSIGVAAGPIGDGTHVAVVTIDAKGRVTGLVSTPITGAAPTGAAGGVLSGTYPNPDLAAAVAGAGLALGLNILSVNVDGSTIEITGDALNVKAGGIGTTQLANAGPGATGPIGDATTVPIVTIDAKGRVVALGSATISGVAPGGAAGGVLDGSYPNPGLAAGVAGDGLAETANVLSVNVDNSTIAITTDTLGVKAGGIGTTQLANAGPGATGPLGDATHVPVVTIDAKGRVTGLTSVLITGTAPGGAAGGVLAGTYPNPSFAVDMATQAELDAAVALLIPKATLDANSVLIAVADDTPVALAMGASTFLARLATGNIVAATVPEAKVLLNADLFTYYFGR